MTSTAKTVLVALLFALALPWSARGQEPSVFVRLYYSSWMLGKVRTSPLDPQGALTEEERLTQNPKAELEAIVLGHLGISFSRQKLHRGFQDTDGVTTGCATAPCVVEENAVHEALNLTLYGRRVAHDQFNLFIGGGAGKLDYDFSSDGTRLDEAERHKEMSLSRWFTGVEYSFDRIGFRLEWSRARARKSFQDQQAELDETFQYLTVFIPLN